MILLRIATSSSSDEDSVTAEVILSDDNNFALHSCIWICNASDIFFTLAELNCQHLVAKLSNLASIVPSFILSDAFSRRRPSLSCWSCFISVDCCKSCRINSLRSLRWVADCCCNCSSTVRISCNNVRSAASECRECCCCCRCCCIGGSGGGGGGGGWIDTSLAYGILVDDEHARRLLLLAMPRSRAIGLTLEKTSSSTSPLLPLLPLLVPLLIL